VLGVEPSSSRSRSRSHGADVVSLRVSLLGLSKECLWTGYFPAVAFAHKVFCAALKLKVGYHCSLLHGQEVVRGSQRLRDFVSDGNSVIFHVIWSTREDYFSVDSLHCSQFVAVQASGAVHTWGCDAYQEFFMGSIVGAPFSLVGVKQICGNTGAFAALQDQQRVRLCKDAAALFVAEYIERL